MNAVTKTLVSLLYLSICGRVRTDANVGVAGAPGFEPGNGGIKIRCLNQLGDSPARNRILGNYAVLLDSLLAARPRTGNPVYYQGASGCSLRPLTAQPRHCDGNSVTAARAVASSLTTAKAAEPEPVMRAGPKCAKCSITSVTTG